MSAGEHLSDEVFALWKDRFGLDIYEAVGMSEFSYYLSQSKHRPIRPGSAGFPQPGHDIRLLDPETLVEVPRGEEGMICIPEDGSGPCSFATGTCPRRRRSCATTAGSSQATTRATTRTATSGSSGARTTSSRASAIASRPYEVERVLEEPSRRRRLRVHRGRRRARQAARGGLRDPANRATASRPTSSSPSGASASLPTKRRRLSTSRRNFRARGMVKFFVGKSLRGSPRRVRRCRGFSAPLRIEPP